MTDTLQTAGPLAVAKALSEIQSGIKSGPGNFWWDGLKRGRAEFGHSVFVPVLTFESMPELLKFNDTGDMPPSMASKMLVLFIDHTCINELGKIISIPAEDLEAQVVSLLDQTKQPYEQAAMPMVVLLDESGKGTSVIGCDTVDWWDTEAETKPYPGITKAKVLKHLRETSPRLAILSTRNPLQAGKNMNAWIEACRELGIQILVDAETSDGLKGVSAQNRAGALTLDFDAKPKAKAKGF